MDANVFLAKLTEIVEDTGITELVFTVADCGGYDVKVSDTPGIFMGKGSMVGDDEILIGGSESDYDPDYIGGENDLLREDDEN